jgi:crotonobetainyl-CoA:carnitine CoA-transferase CaiB-like acyl-CoA transferase
MLAGPYAAMLLAGMGADVIKVEPIDGDPARSGFGPPFVEGDSTYFQAVNQDKRSIAIDLRQDAARPVLGRLLAGADVLVHNLRPRSLARLGLDEESVRAARPDIVYCSINAFGLSGPLADRPGMDLVFQGLSGHMSLTGAPGGEPVRSAAQVVDVATGAYAAAAIAGALAGRARTGDGRRVDVNLLDVGFALQTTIFSYFFATGSDPERVGSGSYVSVTNCFPTADGHVNVTIPHDAHWKRLCEALDRVDLLEDPRYATNEDRVVRRREVEAELRETFGERVTDDWIERLTRAGVPCGGVLSYSEAVAQPQVVSNEVVVDLPHVAGTTIPGVVSPLRLSGAPLGAHKAPPPLGWHTDEILAEIGLEDEERESLARSGTVRAAGPERSTR